MGMKRGGRMAAAEKEVVFIGIDIVMLGTARHDHHDHQLHQRRVIIIEHDLTMT